MALLLNQGHDDERATTIISSIKSILKDMYAWDGLNADVAIPNCDYSDYTLFIYGIGQLHVQLEAMDYRKSILIQCAYIGYLNTGNFQYFKVTDKTKIGDFMQLLKKEGFVLIHTDKPMGDLDIMAQCSKNGLTAYIAADEEGFVGKAILCTAFHIDALYADVIV